MSTPNDRNQAIIEELRANAGKVRGFFAGKTLLLHTIGARTGRGHVNPVAYVRDGDRFVIIASKGGAPTNPDWYHNILAHPHGTVEVGVAQLRVVASVASELERTLLYDKMIGMMPFIEEYRRKSTRVIPVIILRRENDEAN